MEAQVVCDQSDHDVWLLARRAGIGGSDAPAIMGLEKAFGTPFTVACTKRGLAPPDDHETELMRWGHYVEQPMIAAFAEESGLDAKLSSLMYRRVDDGFEFMQTTLDGMVVEDGKLGAIECKLAIYSSEEWEREGVPEHVVCQCQHTMETMGWDFIYVLALLDGYRLRWKRIDRNTEVLGDLIMPAEREFWQRLQDGDQFDAGIGRPGASKMMLAHLHPDDNGETINLGEDRMVEIYDEWEMASADEKAGKTRKEQARNRLAQAMGDHTFARIKDGRKLSFRSQTRTSESGKSTTFRTMRTKK